MGAVLSISSLAFRFARSVVVVVVVAVAGGSVISSAAGVGAVLVVVTAAVLSVVCAAVLVAVSVSVTGVAAEDGVNTDPNTDTGAAAGVDEVVGEVVTTDGQLANGCVCCTVVVVDGTGSWKLNPPPLPNENCGAELDGAGGIRSRNGEAVVAEEGGGALQVTSSRGADGSVSCVGAEGAGGSATTGVSLGVGVGHTTGVGVEVVNGPLLTVVMVLWKTGADACRRDRPGG